MPHNAGSEPYRVGKGKPPREHQFKKGQPSPNPRGRPKGSSRESLLQKMLKKKVWVTGTDGRRVRKSLQEIIDHRLIEAAAGSDLKAIKLVNELLIMHERFQVARQPTREEIIQQLEEEEQLREAQAKTQAMFMEYLEILEDLRRYGITEPGGDFADWVLKAAAEHDPDAYWASDLLES
jgi:hypothetical protein